MIDFHTHILPEVDDGPKSYDETIEVLLEAKKAGFEKIIATSHYALDCYEVPEYKRKELINELNKEDNIPEIILGSEIFLTHNIIDLLKEYKASSINGTNYVLLELPTKINFEDVKNSIIKLKENNYRVILAHPERYTIIQKNVKLLYELKNMGVLFQSNYGSIIGMYGFSAKRTIKKMLKMNLVNFLGSDVHKKKTIYSKISIAINKILKLINEEELKNISHYNIEKILKGEDLI